MYHFFQLFGPIQVLNFNQLVNPVDFSLSGHPVVVTSGQPNRKLYESVQKFIDKVINEVEDHILGLTEQGIQINYQYNLCYYVGI